VTTLNAQLIALWHDYAAAGLLGAGTVGLLALLGLVVWAKKTRRPLRPFALSLSMNLALLLNAEGMWMIATGDLGLSPVFAALVFAVFEICFLTSTSLAGEQYRRTTTYGPDGTVVSPGHPGPMLYVAALIALVSGVIVASNAHTGTEKMLRLAVPAVIFLMWWAALTAAGQKARRGRFAYSPRRLAERWGWLIPDDDPDLIRMAADRQARRMVINYYRVAAGRWPGWWWRARLFKDARTAGEQVVADVVQQLTRVQAFMSLLPADQRTDPIVPGPAGEQIREQIDALSGLLSSRPADLSGQHLPDLSGQDLTDVSAAGEPGRPSADGELSAGSAGAAGQNRTAGGMPPRLPEHRPGRFPQAETAPAGTVRWRAAVQQLRETLLQEIRVEDLHGQPGRGNAELADLLALQVPALDRVTVQAFIDDYVLALTGHDRRSDLPWGDLLPEPASATASGAGPRTDDELLDAYGEQLQTHRISAGELTRYRVEQITGAKARQADRLRSAIEDRITAELVASSR